IIGDHSVTINETTYTDGDENGGTIFRVRVVDVKPLNDTTATDNIGNPTIGNNESSTELPTTNSDSDEDNDSNKREELTTQATRSVETVEELDNEINNKNNAKNQIETLNA
ncbi:icarapin-like, partial [Copidosoma floridanum]|uniref:icarapin-like n=1 Tax=Copidosoma floridanum TaxID=29053 RepID=UPI0006C95B00